MSTTIIQIVDNGANCKYKLSPSTNMLGRRYDNNADFIQVQFPEIEIQSGTTCTMMVEDLQGNVLDHIEVKNNELTPIYNNISQNISINIGFYFSGDNNYIKNSEYQLFRFCDALKPDGFVPVTPVQSGNIDKLIQQGVIDVRWKEGTNNVLEIVRLDSKNNTELELSPFVQEQSDLAETNTSSETFVKNKSTKYLENEGEDGSSPYATEKYVDEHSAPIDAVLYTPQTLTEEQQAQARENIGVIGGEPIAEAIRDNTTQIVKGGTAFEAGGAIPKPNFDSTYDYYVAIGKNANAKYGGIAIGLNSTVDAGGSSDTPIAIGRSSEAKGSNNIAIGQNAKLPTVDNKYVNNRIQLGSGTNSTENSLQVYSDNIYNHSTHTATFQNLQIDGVDEYPTLSGANAPTTTTVGKVKQFYVETTTPALYYCSSITGTGTTEDPYVYNWTQAGGDETLAKQIQNNEVQIAGSQSNYFQGGTSNESRAVYNCTLIGNGAGMYSQGSHATALGAQATASPDSIAVGYRAVTTDNATNSVQLGQGTNKTANSFQINADNIYKIDTHTLTVQNAQVNGNNVYGVLQGETDPVETTVGAVGQFYLNTASKALWQCVAITTTTDATTYTWQQVGGSTEKKYLHVINFWVTSPYNFGVGNYHLEIISSIKDSIGTTAIDLAKFLYDNDYRSGYIDTSTVNSGKGPCIVSNRFAAVSTDSGSSLARTLGLYGQFSATSATYALYDTTDLIQGNKATIKINNNSYNMLQSLYSYGSTSENITNKIINKIADTVVEL